ncbi:uncharacterized protein LOC132322519 [Haemorhous mexicanus]|uniref:uncharacterized protein LOC132322519 n=1 Tax=Haemorhous mexicanus TaxID=30427 RepID=UPI0028BEB0EA|nr:uncharacterized protein LOC132322519 [Haemorhous mexicanus]
MVVVGLSPLLRHLPEETNGVNGVPGEKLRLACPQVPTVHGPSDTARLVQFGPQGPPTPADKPRLEQGNPDNRKAASSLPPRHLPGGVQGRVRGTSVSGSPPRARALPIRRTPPCSPPLPGYRDTVCPPSPVPVPLRGQEQRGGPATLRGADRAAPPASRPPAAHAPEHGAPPGDTALPRTVSRGCAPAGHRAMGIPLPQTALLRARAARPDAPGLGTVPRPRSVVVLHPLLTPHPRAPTRPRTSPGPRMTPDPSPSPLPVFPIPSSTLLSPPAPRFRGPRASRRPHAPPPFPPPLTPTPPTNERPGRQRGRGRGGTRGARREAG